MNSLSISAGASILIVLVVTKYMYDRVLRPQWYLRNIPGPPRDSLIVGNMRAIRESEPGAAYRQWHKSYGHTIRFDGFFSNPRLCTTDKRALQHVLLSDPYMFPKPDFVRHMLASVLGEGLVVVEGTDHRRQRKIMNPSFGPAHIKSLYPIFVEKALLLRDTMRNQMAGSSTRLDIYAYANRATLDIIAAAGFGYETSAIEHGNNNELANAFNAFFHATTDVTTWHVLTAFFPALNKLPDWSPRVKATNHATRTMCRIGAQIVEGKKQDAVATLPITSKDVPFSGVEASQMVGRDLLSVLVKANMASDLKPSQKLNDRDVAAQISTFLLAGNDTTANAISWAIYGLCKYPETQRKLRNEVSNFLGSPDSDSNVPSYDALNALPYLDAVMRETLRLYAPVAATGRTATEDCVIPLAEPIIDRNGVKKTEIFIAKNTVIFVPIAHIMTNISSWGPDADEFRPERWLPDAVHMLPEGVMEIPSIAFPTFLAGARSCIGFRFAIIEIKIILFSLIRAMKFELAVSAEDIEARSNIVTRPRIKSRRAEGWQLPVNVTPVEQV